MTATASSFHKAQDYHDSIEHYRIGHHLEGLYEPAVDSDVYTRIDANEGWVEPDEVLSRHDRFIDAVDVLVPILLWLAKSATVHSAGLRALAFVSTVRPDLIGTQHRIAAQSKVGRAAISKYVSQIYRLSNGLFIRAHTCSNGARRAQMARICRQTKNSKRKV